MIEIKMLYSNAFPNASNNASTNALKGCANKLCNLREMETISLLCP